MKLATPSFVSFTTISKERPLFYEKKYDLRSAHAVFMTIAWIGLVSIGILLPRYHKDSWPGRSIADKDIWLFLHMGLMSGAVILIHVAIVLIFIDVNGWVDAAHKTANAHAVIGIIITIFITFQAAGGVLRPEPESEVRYVFRYIHSNTGYVILAFGLLNIYLGSLLQHGVPVWSGYILLFFILFYLWMQFGYALVRRPNQVYDKNYASRKLTLTELLFYAYIVMAVIFTIFLAALYGHTA